MIRFVDMNTHTRKSNGRLLGEAFKKGCGKAILPTYWVQHFGAFRPTGYDLLIGVVAPTPDR